MSMKWKPNSSGRESFEQYDAFIDTIYSMGIEEAIEIQQRTYDDYLNR